MAIGFGLARSVDVLGAERIGVSYLHLPAASPPPRVTWPTPFIAVLVLEQAVAADWQAEISRWLAPTARPR